MSKGRFHDSVCTLHGKRLYASRAIARWNLRVMGAAGRGMRAYRCTHVPGSWHVGHLPAPVRRGHITFNELRGGDGGRI